MIPGSRYFPIGLAALAAVFLLASCEKAAPYLDQVKKALDRETDEELAARKPVAPEDIPPPPAPVKMEPVVNKEARVSILGYHDFTDGTSISLRIEAIILGCTEISLLVDQQDAAVPLFDTTAIHARAAAEWAMAA